MYNSKTYWNLKKYFYWSSYLKMGASSSISSIPIIFFKNAFGLQLEQEFIKISRKENT